MKREELYTQEGLFLIDFSEDFFEERINENEEIKEFIQEITRKVKERKKKENQPIWHCIFYELITAYKKTSSFGNNKLFGEVRGLGNDDLNLKRILVDFYEESLYLTTDIAQKIIYNLSRLDENVVYDVGTIEDLESIEEEGWRNFLSTGKGEYNKDIETDLVDDLNKFVKKYKDCEKPEIVSVYLPRIISGNKITLEYNFKELNLLFIGNLEFQEFLCHRKKRSGYNDMLEKQIKNLDSQGVDLHYIWEKMTNFNAISIVTKFLVEMVERKTGIRTEREKKNEIEILLKEESELFYQIRNMPNVLTKLLLLKMAFNYIEKLSYATDGIGTKQLHELSHFLNNIREPYLNLQKYLLEIAALVRWNVDNKQTKNTWMQELEKEYPQDLFQIWMLSLNIKDDLVSQGRLYRGGIENIENRSLYTLLKPTKDVFFSVKQFLDKSNLLQCIKQARYYNESNAAAELLKNAGWVTVKSVLEGEELQDENYVKVCVEKIFTGVASEEEMQKAFEMRKDDVENIERHISPWLLSQYNNVIYENTNSLKNEYREIINLLLYHFFQ